MLPLDQSTFWPALILFSYHLLTDLNTVCPADYPEHNPTGVVMDDWCRVLNEEHPELTQALQKFTVKDCTENWIAQQQVPACLFLALLGNMDARRFKQS